MNPNELCQVYLSYTMAVKRIFQGTSKERFCQTI